MDLYTIEEITDIATETYPSYDFESRRLTFKRYAKEALRKVQGVKDKALFTGVKLDVQLNNEAELPKNLNRLLNVYGVKNGRYFPVDYKQYGNKLEFYIDTCDFSCVDIRINYHGDGDEIAYSNEQKDYAMHYALEVLLRNDLMSNPSLSNFYQLVVSQRDFNFAPATRKRLSLDEINNAIMAYRYGKYYTNSNSIMGKPF